MEVRLAAAVALVGQGHRRLHDRPGAPIHVELAAREPTQVGWIGSVEQQQRRLPSRRAQLQLDAPLAVFGPWFEPRLPRDVGDHYRLEFQVDQFMRAGLEYLHNEGSLYRRPAAAALLSVGFASAILLPRYGPSWRPPEPPLPARTSSAAPQFSRRRLRR